MSFTEAVQDGFEKYVGFEGRSSRSAYWWWYLFSILAYLVAIVIDTVLGTGLVFYMIVAIGIFLPSLAVSVRRLHDTNKTGWWILIGFIPLIGAIVLLVFFLTASDPGPNQYGQGPDSGGEIAPPPPDGSAPPPPAPPAPPAF